MSKNIKIQNIHALTPLQEGILIHNLLDKESRAYVEQLLFSIQGRFDLQKCKESFEQMVNRHDVCRTIFKHTGVETPLQIVLQGRIPKLQVEDISELVPVEQAEYITRYQQMDRKKGFDLTKDLPIRLAVLQTAENGFTLLLSFHHIVMDGWSLSIFLQEFFAIYGNPSENWQLALPTTFDYGQYLQWINKQNRERAAEFWRESLRDYETEATLPVGTRAHVKAEYEVREHKFSFDEQLTNRLQSLAQRENVTLNTVMQTLWGVLLQRYNGSDDVVFGSVVAGRPAELIGIEQAVGMFINTVPVRVISKGQTFAELLREVYRAGMEAAAYEYYPLYEMQSVLSGNRTLFDHVMAFESFPLATDLVNLDKNNEIIVQTSEYFSQTNYHFNIIIVPGKQLSVSFSYNSNVYGEDGMNSLEQHLKRLAEAIVDQPACKVEELNPLTEEEQVKLLTGWNQADVSYPKDATLTSLFEAQTERTPERTAVVCGEERLTYEELNRRANRLARRLQREGVGPDTLVGLLLGRTSEMIVAMLGVLKAGGAYVPIDPAYPQERIAFMLRDSGARVLIAGDGLEPDRSELPDYAARVISAHDNEEELEETNLAAAHGPEHLAYIIYTSGTTGTPKGVMIEHRNVVRLLVNDQLPYTFGTEDVWTVFHSFCFDFSVWEMYGALLYGGTCVIVPKETAQSPEAFLGLLESERVTVLNQTPTAFYALVQEAMAAPDKRDLALRYIIFGGEALQPIQLRSWKRAYPQTKLINMYGITETTVHVTYKEITEAEMEANLSNIGRPIPTLRCYVLDSRRRLVPTGVTGELYVGGDGVARGYLGREELTAERFVANPYAPQERLYKSGDLVRLLPGGELAYIGRIDYQVKIRGHRIETGEIEHRLLLHPQVKEAMVLAVERGIEKELCAYVVLNGELKVGDLREHITRELPAYMVPAYFMMLERMPQTASGKTDRRALPEPKSESESTYVAPRSETEANLAELFKEVLGVELVGVHDHFFELGGHSLKATQLVSKIKKNMGMDLSLKNVFAYPTVEAIAKCLSENETGRTSLSMIKPIERQAWYPVSSSQRRMLVLNQLEDEGTHYHISGAFELVGPLDTARLDAAVQAVLRRHDMLRTSFTIQNERPVQIIHDVVRIPIERYNSASLELQQTIRSFIRPFNLEEAPLFRVGLVELGGERHLLMLDIHHIIADGTSLHILLQEVSRFYNGEELAPLHIQYKDYSVWQQEYEKTEAYKQQETYWLNALSGNLPVLQLPVDFQRPTLQTFEGDEIDFSLNAELKEAAYRYMSFTKTTPFMFLMSVFQLLLAKYSNQDDVIVGTPVAGRTLDDVQQMFGVFINTLAIRSNPGKEKTFEAYLSEMKEASLQAFENQAYPFEELVANLKLPRDLSRNPIFDSMFILQNVESAQLDLAGIYVKAHRAANPSAKFDLLLEAVEKEGELVFSLQYNIALFKRETVERMAAHFMELIRNVLKDPQIRLGELELLTEREKGQLLYEFNDTLMAYDKSKTIPSLFEEQVERTPDLTAVVCQNEQLTYRELNEKANRLARTLRKKGVKSERVVGIMMNRSVNLLIAIMAVLKAGGAYLPIDPEFPEERILYLLEDSQANLLLTDQALEDRIQFSGGTLSFENGLDSEWNSSQLEDLNSSYNLAYLIYTSGSTGKPKGVMVEHRSVHNYILGMSQACRLTDYQTMLAITTVSFDIFVTETLLPLCQGMTVVLATEAEQKDPALLRRLMEQQDVEVMQTTPSRMQMLCNDPDALPAMQKLHAILIGGEAFPNPLLNILQANTSARIYNIYGPTETTVFSTVSDLTEETYIHIGRPIANTQVYIINQSGNPLPIGVTGELCIGGDGTARGYWQREDLTRDRFLENPFQPGSRMYRTGDLARWTSEGRIECLGRMDHQVKIRGYRIELGELEAVLLEHSSVAKAAVIDWVNPQGEPYLCGYIVPKPNHDVDLSEVRTHLMKWLPNYMVPDYIMRLDDLKLTPNGKIDRNALPETAGYLQEVSRSFKAPATPVEREMEQIWKHLLGLDRIDVKESFFEIGGHSLKATLLMAKIKEVFHVKVSLKEVFLHPTIEELSSLVQNTKLIKEDMAIEPLPEQDYYELSSAQQRMYFVQRLKEASTSYNMPSFFSVTGDLNFSRVESVVKSLVKRHESLRTSFMVMDGNLSQRVQPDVDMTVSFRTAKPSEIDAEIKKFIQPFDLGQAPLFRAGVIRCDSNLHILMFDMHHIISDGVSQNVLQQEFIRLYQGETLEPLRIQYRDYAYWQRRRADSEEYEVSERYWLEQFRDVPVLNLPTDFVRPQMQSFEGGSLTKIVNSALTGSLKKLAGETGTTLYMVLLSGFHILLHKYSGQDELVIGSPVAGRQHSDLQQIIGMFVNMIALRGNPVPQKTFLELLSEVKDTAVEAFMHQDYAYEQLVDRLELGREINRNPLFDVVFTMQNEDMDITLHDDILQFVPYQWQNEAAKFDLTMEAVERKDGTQLTLQYAASLFQRDTAERLLQHYVRILEMVCEQPSVLVGNIDVLTVDERLHIIKDFNQTAWPYPKHSTIHRVFEEQVMKTPNKIALQVEGEALTYRELNERSSRMAAALKGYGVGKDTIVALITERHLEMFVAMLAILKAGGAYMPLDPDLPMDRVAYMLQDSGASLVITEGAYREQLQSIGFRRTVLALHEDDLYSDSPWETAGEGDDGQLAYIMYTSGSTGRPKGVMVEHHNVLRLVIGSNFVTFDDNDRMLLTGATGFDATTFEIWGTFLNGLTLYVIPKEFIMQADLLHEKLIAYGITTMWLTAPLFHSLVQQHDQLFSSLKYLLVGGDVVSPPHVHRAYAGAADSLQIINAYGPTENTTFSTYYPISKNDEGPFPIGKPISNSTVYILDGQGNPLPIRAVGELYVGGDGVARGYLNNPELTAEKFVPNPFEPGQMMYRTGDLCKWRADGNIEFLGRMDSQIKIRGYRVEPKEVEAKLLNHPSIRAAVVLDIMNADGHKALCAYIVQENELPVSKYREFLSWELPPYMIPAYFVKIDELPLNANGKINRRLLPEPALELMETETDYEAPRNDMEMLLVEVWEEVLGHSPFGIHHNFFHSGGDSIKAIQIASRLKQKGLKLDMKDMFLYPTISQLAPFIQTAQLVISQEPVEGQVILTPIQKWFFACKYANPHHWNQSVMLHSHFHLDEEALKSVLRQLVIHHDALRMVFRTDNDEVVQWNSATATVDQLRLDIIDLTDITDDLVLRQCVEAGADKLQSSFELTRAPLLAAGLFRTCDGDHLLLVVHHLVIDGVSWRILLEDLAIGYEQAVTGSEVRLPEKTTSFRDWSSKLQAHAQSKVLLKEKSYWANLEQIGGAPLPIDYIASINRVADTRSIAMILNEEETEQFTHAHLAYQTEMNDLLLASFGKTVNRWLGRTETLIHLEGHGREQIMEDVDITRTLGWFTTMFPVALMEGRDKELGALVVKTKEMLRKIPNKGLGYGVLAYMTPNHLRTPLLSEESSRPEISFNYLGEFAVAALERWKPSAMAGGRAVSPESERAHKLDVIGMTMEGRLQFEFVYNSLEFEESTISILAESYKQDLLAILAFCCEKEVTEMTPYDVGQDHDLSIEELQDLSEVLSKKIKF